MLVWEAGVGACVWAASVGACVGGWCGCLCVGGWCVGACVWEAGVWVLVWVAGVWMLVCRWLVTTRLQKASCVSISLVCMFKDGYICLFLVSVVFFTHKGVRRSAPIRMRGDLSDMWLYCE